MINPENEADRHLAWDCWMTFNDQGDWWTCRFMRLCSTSDEVHLALLALGFLREVEMYLEWRNSNQKAFTEKWGIHTKGEKHERG